MGADPPDLLADDIQQTKEMLTKIGRQIFAHHPALPYKHLISCVVFAISRKPMRCPLRRPVSIRKWPNYTNPSLVILSDCRASMRR